MNMIVDLLMIQVICVLIVDFTGFVDTLKGAVGRWLRIKGEYSLKPIDCSLCMTWWTGFIYLLITGNLTIFYIMITLILANLTDITKAIFYTLKDLIIRILRIIEK